MMLPFLAGIAFALLAIVLLRLSGMSRDRATGPVMLVAIALFYPVFAVDHGGLPAFAVQVMIAALFTAVAILGYRTRLAWVGVGMIAHGLFDAVAHTALNSPAPGWWGPFCIGIDVVLGLWLLTLRPEPVRWEAR